MHPVGDPSIVTIFIIINDPIIINNFGNIIVTNNIDIYSDPNIVTNISGININSINIVINNGYIIIVSNNSGIIIDSIDISIDNGSY